MNIDIQDVAASAIPHALNICQSYLPEGKLAGREYQCSDLTGGKGDSCSVNTTTGKWSDFATDEKGGDLVSLVAAVKHCSQLEAAKELANFIGHTSAMPAPVKPVKQAVWTPILPVPEDAPEPPVTHYKHGKPANIYRYTDKAGKVLQYVFRFEFPSAEAGKKDKKEFFPVAYCRNSDTGKCEWRFQAIQDNRPLYGLAQITDTTRCALLVEGEKAAGAARQKVGHKMPVLTWSCGCGGIDKTDWSPLKGLAVCIWPDNDKPGFKAAVSVADAVMKAGAASVKITPPLENVADGYDAADADADGWTAEQVMQHLKSSIEPDGFRALCIDKGLLEPVRETFTGDPMPDYRPLHNLPERFTDTSIAKDIADKLQGRVEYWREADTWMFWDGQRWCSDIPGGLYPFIQQYIKSAMVEVARTDSLDAETRSRYLKALCQYESHFRQTTLISAMAVIPSLIVETHKLDANPMLLTCLNGTLDLSNGQLLAHNPDHHITRICKIEYVANAPCPTFVSFLQRIFDNDSELIGYIKRFIGYCLTGKTDEQIMVFFYGAGRNGKTTLIRVLLMLLADFACSAQADLLMLKNGEGANNELARLRGARLVAVNEVEEGSRLAEAQLKTLTGGDSVTARFLYKEYFEYEPQFKMVLVGNHKPQIRGRDLGIWRRIHLIPFTVTIPEEEIDPNLTDKLRAELPGILSWAVEGCIEWQRSGLKPPASIRAATEQYRQGEDIFDQWLREYCVTGPEHKTPANDLLDSFKAASGWKHMTPNKFGKLLAEAGFDRYTNGSVRYWIGVGLTASPLNNPYTPDTFTSKKGKYCEENSIGTFGKMASKRQECQDFHIEEPFPLVAVDDLPTFEV